MARAGELGVDDALLFLREIDDINLRQRRRTIEIAPEFLGGDAPGVAFAALGAAFKPDSDDVRDSPALDVPAKLPLQGAHATLHQPRARDHTATVFPHIHYPSPP